MSRLPPLALSVRQPWAWAIIHAGKDIENRSAAAIKHMQPVHGPRAIHASKAMTRKYYDDAAAFMRSIGVDCPAASELQRGGIIGSVTVVFAVTESDSVWFFGQRGLVLRDAKACDFIPSVGALGYFKWQACSPDVIPSPAQWMKPRPPGTPPAPRECDPSLFDVFEREDKHR